MRFFLDCEFIETGPQRPVHLVSLGVKCEDGRAFYAEDEDAPLHLADDWFKTNVTPHLNRKHARPRHQIAQELLEFVGSLKFGTPTFYGYFCAYDWLCVAQLYGRLIDIPQSWPKYCIDLKAIWKMLGGSIKFPKQSGVEHLSLDDSSWNFEVWKILNERWKQSTGLELP